MKRLRPTLSSANVSAPQKSMLRQQGRRSQQATATCTTHTRSWPMNTSLSARYTLPQHPARSESGFLIVLGKSFGTLDPK